MATNLFTVRQVLLYGWNTFRINWQFLLIVFVTLVVIGMLPGYLQTWAKENMPQVSFIISVLSWVIQMVTSIGVIVISLKIVDGKKAEFADIYKHYNLLLNYFLGSLLYGFVVLGGLILLIVPGIIWGIKYQYTTYLIIDKKMSPLDAFKQSGKITQGHKLKLFYLGLAFAGITLLGVITLGLGLIVTWPIVSLSGAYVYRKLLSHSVKG